MKKYLVLIIVLMAIITCPNHVFAHVLLRDSQANIGSVLHINPDDDPIAGKPAQLYFDIQDKSSQTRLPYAAYNLSVTNEANVTSVIPLDASTGSTLLATYTFPVQGLYRLRLYSNARYDNFLKVTMVDSIRISRGLSNPGQVVSPHTVASTIALVSVIVFLVLSIIGFNNRRAIARHSTW
jgi:hypothetical protein